MFDRFSYGARRWLVVLLLCVGMPLYIILCVGLVGLMVTYIGRPPVLVEFALYVVLGVVWIFPFKGLFKGVGKPNPDAEPVVWDDER